MTLYDTLDVNEDASQDEIKKAYRDKAKENHPDKGGSTEKMAEIARAYSVLSDEDKIKHYDQTGEEQERPFESKFMALIQQYFLEVALKTLNLDQDDLIKDFREFIGNIQHNLGESKKEIKQKIKQFENIRKRIKSDKDNSISLFLDAQIDQNKGTLKLIDNDIEFMAKAKEVLKFYKYNFDEITKQEGRTQFYTYSDNI